jgi:hypothetical protein
MCRQHRCAVQPSFWTGQEGRFPVGERAIFAIGESVMLDGNFQFHVIRAVGGRVHNVTSFTHMPVPARSETDIN